VIVDGYFEEVIASKKRRGKIRNDELHGLCCSPNTTAVIR
jgi:hypothetical protein